MTKEQFAELAAVDPSEAYDRLEQEVGLRFASEKNEAERGLKQLHDEQWKWRWERLSWKFLMFLTVFAGVLFAASSYGMIYHKDTANAAENRATVAEQKSERFRIMLLENQIDPETGKRFGK